MPLARDSIRKIAETLGGCLRPVQLRCTDTVTGQTDQVMIPCGTTLASVCPPCAERARSLRLSPSAGKAGTSRTNLTPARPH